MPAATSTASAARAQRRRARPAETRCAASAAASPEMAQRQSVSSRSAVSPGAAADGCSACRASCATNEPPPRPRRVSTKPGVAQDGERLAERHRRDREARGELALARQPLARLEHAGADRLADAADDRLDGSLDLERREHAVAGGDVHRLETSTD